MAWVIKISDKNLYIFKIMGFKQIHFFNRERQCAHMHTHMHTHRERRVISSHVISDSSLVVIWGSVENSQLTKTNDLAWCKQYNSCWNVFSLIYLIHLPQNTYVWSIKYRFWEVGAYEICSATLVVIKNMQQCTRNDKIFKLLHHFLFWTVTDLKSVNSLMSFLWIICSEIKQTVHEWKWNTLYIKLLKL